MGSPARSWGSVGSEIPLGFCLRSMYKFLYGIYMYLSPHSTVRRYNSQPPAHPALKMPSFIILEDNNSAALDYYKI